MRMLPVVGASRPLTSFKRVLLPHPLGPSKAMNSFSATVSEMLSSAFMGSPPWVVKRLPMSASSIIGPALAHQRCGRPPARDDPLISMQRPAQRARHARTVSCQLCVPALTSLHFRQQSIGEKLVRSRASFQFEVRHEHVARALDALAVELSNGEAPGGDILVDGQRCNRFGGPNRRFELGHGGEFQHCLGAFPRVSVLARLSTYI